MMRKILLVLVCSLAIASVFSNNMLSYAAIPPNKPPRLAIDLIHGYEISDSVRSQAVSLGYQIHEISGGMIQENDLDGINIVLISIPCVYIQYHGQLPEYTQSEIDLLVNFVEKGGALYIVPMYCYYNVHFGGHNLKLSTSVNVLFDYFGFRVSGEHYVLEYPTKAIESTHPIMDKVNKIEVAWGTGEWHDCGSVVILSILESPCASIYSDEGYPLFLVSGIGKGKVFVDLTSHGIGYKDIFDNLLVVRNALIWLKGFSTETYRVVTGDDFYDIRINTNSTLSSFSFDNTSCKIHFYATGLRGTIGFCNVTIPKGFMWCDNIQDWVVNVNSVSPSDIVKTEDATSTCLCFTYSHSSHNIEIIAQHVVAEFPSFLILLLFMMATLLAVVVYARKNTVDC